MMNFPFLEVVGTLIGILYIVLEYRASVWLWPVGVVMPLIYIVIYYQAGIYADMGINVYFLVAAIYGWIIWSRGRKKDDTQAGASDELKIEYTSAREWIYSTLIFAAIFAFLAYILINFTPSTVPYSDSFTTALSVIGMWMLAHKRIEHWLVWIAVDAVSSVMYISKGLYPTSALYLLYTIIAIAGFLKWRRMMRGENE